MHRLIIRCLAIVGVAALLQADAWNKKTELTVNQKIEVPGAVLTPGKYVVKLVDSQSNRHIVQFTNEAGDQVISTVLAIPNERLEPTGDSEFAFYETSVGGAPALRAWFYPGDNFGQQFAYPKDRALELARASGEDVPSLSGNDLSSGQPSTVSPKENETAASAPPPTESATTPPPQPTAQTRTQPAAPSAQPAPRPDPTLMAQAERPQAGPATPPSQPSQQPDAGEAQRSTLPSTASPAPLLGLIGLLSLGGAFGLRRLTRQREMR
jgi:hypothetical protein